MPQPPHHKLIVIGAGSAGYAAARTFAQSDPSVAIVDGAEQLGGLCILRGCMPSKTLIYAAETLHRANHSQALGLVGPKLRMDMSKLHQRKLALISDFQKYRVDQLLSDRLKLYRSNAHFVNDHQIELDDGTLLSADNFLISTGSINQWPAIPGLSRENAITSDQVLDLDYVPHSVAVLGGGIVACELGQFLNRIGAKVTFVQRSARILKECSESAASVISSAFIDESIDLVTSTKLLEVKKESSGFSVRYDHLGSNKELSISLVFNALGRIPNTKSLNLKDAGVRTDQRGAIVADLYHRSSQPHIYAAGDVCGPYEIVHVAIQQGERAARLMRGDQLAPIDYSNECSVVFTDPQVAFVGMREETLNSRGINFSTSSCPFNDHGKSMLMDANYGYVKLWVEAGTAKILAAECVGRDASELIHMMTVPVQLGLTTAQVLQAAWYHPTLAEIWSYPLEELNQ